MPNPAKVRQQLTEYNLVAEEYGGETIFVDVSAKQGTNIDQLLESILLTADAALDLRAVADAPARGVAIEAHLDRGRGPVATVLVQRGTLAVGDSIVAGDAYGRVRAMLDEHGENLDVALAVPARCRCSASPRCPAPATSSSSPTRTASPARSPRSGRPMQRNAALAKARKRVSLEDWLEQSKVDTLNLILKGDGSGSVEALEDALMNIEVGDEVELRVIDRGVGAITQNDVNLAVASDAVIIGFNVRPAERVGDLIEREGVDVRYYSVIYQAIDEVEAALKGMLKPEYEEVAARHRRDPRGVPVQQVRQHRGCAGPQRRDPPQRQGAPGPRRRRGGGQPHRRVAASGSRTTRPRCARATSAASAWGRSTTSRSTT